MNTITPQRDFVPERADIDVGSGNVVQQRRQASRPKENLTIYLLASQLAHCAEAIIILAHSPCVP